MCGEEENMERRTSRDEQSKRRDKGKNDGGRDGRNRFKENGEMEHEENEKAKKRKREKGHNGEKFGSCLQLYDSLKCKVFEKVLKPHFCYTGFKCGILCTAPEKNVGIEMLVWPEDCGNRTDRSDRRVDTLSVDLLRDLSIRHGQA